MNVSDTMKALASYHWKDPQPGEGLSLYGGEGTLTVSNKAGAVLNLGAGEELVPFIQWENRCLLCAYCGRTYEKRPDSGLCVSCGAPLRMR